MDKEIMEIQSDLAILDAGLPCGTKEVVLEAILNLNKRLSKLESASKHSSRKEGGKDGK